MRRTNKRPKPITDPVMDRVVVVTMVWSFAWIVAMFIIVALDKFA